MEEFVTCGKFTVQNLHGELAANLLINRFTTFRRQDNIHYRLTFSKCFTENLYETKNAPVKNRIPTHKTAS